MYLSHRGCHYPEKFLPVRRWQHLKSTRCVGRTVEFRGLKAQYLFLFAGGLLAVFILVVILYLCGISQIACLVIGGVGASLVVWQTFTMNRKYGQYGLMKKGAVRMHPRYLVNRRTVCHLIRNLQPKKAKK